MYSMRRLIFRQSLGTLWGSMSPSRMYSMNFSYFPITNYFVVTTADVVHVRHLVDLRNESLRQF